MGNILISVIMIMIIMMINMMMINIKHVLGYYAVIRTLRHLATPWEMIPGG